MSQEGTRFEFECYDVGHLYTLAHLLDRSIVEPPLFVQLIFGILGVQAHNFIGAILMSTAGATALVIATRILRDEI